MYSAPVALVTGASRGIGQAIANALAEDRCHVAIADVLDAGDTVAMVEARGFEALAIACDISSSADRAAAVQQIRDRFGRLDVLVNNAGVAPKQRADLLEASEESFDRLMRINLKGPYFLTQLVARWMVEQRQERPDDPMSIVNISSISAYTASPSRGEYCVSKAGVSMMTKLFAVRLAEHNINVYEIRPGIVATDMTAPVKEKYDKLIAEGLTPIRRWQQPEDIARAVLVATSGMLPVSTGEVINVDGGFHLRQL